MRPDEYKQQDAERWTEAVQLRNVINEERQRAQDEYDALKRIQADV